MRQSTLNKAKQILFERHSKAIANYENLLATLRQDGQYKRVDTNIRMLEVQQLTDNCSQLQQQLQQLKTTKEQYLSRLGYTQQQLAPQFTCSHCSDSGYVDGKMCSCMLSVIKSIVIGQGNINLPQYTFGSSNESNPHNQQVYDVCQQLCNKLGTSQYCNLLLTGKTGTGKTYLCASIANHLLDQGQEVLFITSYKLNSNFLTNHLSSVEAITEYLDNLCDIDVLIIDDLGAENHYNNVSIEYLFDVINERTLTNKATFISTNLSLSDIRERYGDRLFSRLSNQSTTLVLQLLGKDKRTTK